MTQGPDNQDTNEPVEQLPEPEAPAPTLFEESAEEPEAAAQVPAEEPETQEVSDDDLGAAIAEAGTNVVDEASFDAIAPGTVAEGPDVDSSGSAAGLSVRAATSVSWVPFVVYDVLWVAFAGLLVWQFSTLPKTQAIFQSSLYPLAVLGGLVLSIAGPVLILAVWVASWGREGSRKGPLFVSALMKGSVATLAGVLLWWGALLLLDQLRLGRLL